jgi:hypothetical protein
MGFNSVGPVCFESVSAVTATPTVELGTVRWESGEVFEYVYASTTVPVGYGGAYTGTSGHTVVATGIVSGEYAAGFCKHATIAGGTYGWLLKKGVLDVKNGRAGTATVINDLLYMGADGAVVTDVKVVTSAIDHGHIVGKVLSAGASGGTGASLTLCYVSVF